MSTTTVKVGQVYKSRDGGSLFKVREVTSTFAVGATPDGRRPREIAIKRLLAKGRNGYELVEDAPEATPSPLEVVRKALASLSACSTSCGYRCISGCSRRAAIDALATLEESIRAEEREKVLRASVTCGCILHRGKR